MFLEEVLSEEAVYGVISGVSLRVGEYLFKYGQAGGWLSARDVIPGIATICSTWGIRGILTLYKTFKKHFSKDFLVANSS